MVGATKALVAISFGFVLFGLAANAQTLPKNSELDYTGNNWKCVKGYRRSENSCVAVDVPENAELDYTGSRWKCVKGYRRSENNCVAVDVPENAELDYTGNNWKCKYGFTRSGNACRPMTAAELAQYEAKLRAALIRAQLCGKRYNYDVSGNGSSGYVYGNIDACSKSKEVEGYITLEDGAEVYFEGEWVGKGEVEGYGENGDYYYLEVD